MASNSHINICLALSDTAAQVTAKLTNNNPELTLLELIQSVASGMSKGKLLFHVDAADGVKAAQTIVWSGKDGVAGNTVTVGDVVLTATADYAPSGGSYFTLSSDDTTQAENFDRIVNTHPVLSKIVSAANDKATTTLTLVEGGTFGNLLSLATSNTALATLGAATFASGAAGTKSMDVNVAMQCANLP